MINQTKAVKRPRSIFFVSGLLYFVFPFLSSCVWNIGECIRSSTAVHVGADLSNPAEVEAYGYDYFADEYFIAPEVTYRYCPDLVEFCVPNEPPYKVHDMKRTGYKVLVRDGLEWETTDKIPADAKRKRIEDMYDPRKKRDTNRELGDLDSPRASRGSIPAQIAAAPFDFVIDPVLSATTSVFTFLGYCFVEYCWPDFEQREEK